MNYLLLNNVPRDAFKEASGLHWYGIEKNCLNLKSDSSCTFLVISTKSAPDFSFWQESGDVAIHKMHFWITNGDSFDGGRLGSADSIINSSGYRVAFPVSFSESRVQLGTFFFCLGRP